MEREAVRKFMKLLSRKRGFTRRSFIGYYIFYSMKIYQRVGRCRNGATFAFMHHPYLVCIVFGMPSLHLFTFLMFFIYLCINAMDWYTNSQLLI